MLSIEGATGVHRRFLTAALLGCGSEASGLDFLQPTVLFLITQTPLLWGY